MDEIKAEAMDIAINSIIRCVYESEMDEEDCMSVILNSFSELSETMSPEYSELFEERANLALEELENEVESQLQVESIMEDIGWELRN